MSEPNKHDWHSLFDGNACRICRTSIFSGTGKAEHARKHMRENKAARVGLGTSENPFRYVITGVSHITLTEADLHYIELALVAMACKGNPASGSCHEVREKLICLRNKNDHWPEMVEIKVTL